MAKSKSKSPKGGRKKEQKGNAAENLESSSSSAQKKKKEKHVITMEALEAISSSDEDEQKLPPVSQWDSMAKNLKKAIDEGAFEHLLTKKKKEQGDDDDDDDEIEEVTLDSKSDEEGDDGKNTQKQDETMENSEEENGDDDDDESSSNDDDEEGAEKKKIDTAEGEDESDDSGKNKTAGGKAQSDDDEEEEEEDDDEHTPLATAHIPTIAEKNVHSAKALAIVTAKLQSFKSGVPWPETFEVVPTTPLPFGVEHGDPESNPLDIHDDLKREAAFYNTALEAVRMARAKCQTASIPFSRPDDFFAEMVKTDEHMAKVKDRLIFETKKMEAVAQRKSNREQKLRSKESHSNKLAEKSKRKKDHFKQVEDWAKNAASNRGGALKDGDDDAYLSRMGGGGVSKKRQAADRKFGHGGKKGRFKQNDRQTLNDTSGFNPRGNFSGVGSKKTAKSPSGSGAKRQGKRARDAGRSRRS